MDLGRKFIAGRMLGYDVEDRLVPLAPDFELIARAESARRDCVTKVSGVVVTCPACLSHHARTKEFRQPPEADAGGAKPKSTRSAADVQISANCPIDTIFFLDPRVRARIIGSFPRFFANRSRKEFEGFATRKPLF
jgi:hypothetical protein